MLHGARGFEENLERLIANWPTLGSRIDVLRSELNLVFYEVGSERFTRATDAIITSGTYQYFPSIAEFRGYIPQPALDEAKIQRYSTLKEKFEFDRFIEEINYLAERAQKYPDDARRAKFQRSRIVGIFHFWLTEHHACVARLPEHLEWVTNEISMRRYVADNPAPAVTGKWDT